MSEVSEPDFEWHLECARARPLPATSTALQAFCWDDVDETQVSEPRRRRDGHA